MYYFFCPNCKHEDKVESLPKGIIRKTIDEYGTQIYLFECPVCSNLDAGYMRLWDNNDKYENEDFKYLQAVIEGYQNI